MTSTCSAAATGLPSNRRGFITSLAAAGLLTSGAARAAPDNAAHLDAALLALREPFDRTWRDYRCAIDIYGTAEDAAQERRAAEPSADRVRIKAEVGLTAAEDLVDKTGDANRAIVEAMCMIPAHTIDGLAFKAKVSLEHEDNLFEELVTSIMDDILAMGGAHA